MTEAGRFARSVALRTAAAWIIGVLALSGLAARLVQNSKEESLDLRLRAHALAVYGLGWFDAQGVFHDEVLRKETVLLASDVDVVVWSENGPVFRSEHARASPPELGALVSSVLAKNHEAWSSGVNSEGEPFRLLALPTYDDADRLAGVVVAIGDPRPGHREWLRFVQRLGLAAAVLIVAGLGASAALASRLYAHLHEGIRERERFLAGAAHELRTPVATLLAVVASAEAGDESAGQALTRVGTIAGQTAELVDRLLTLARLDEMILEQEPLRLDLLVDTCLADGEPASLEACVVSGDPRLLAIVVHNLLRNARVHGRGVAKVVVRDGDLVISDHGPGFPADRDLTAPFVKGPNSAGSGLGLALVARIVAAHGGQIQLGPGGQVSVRLRSWTDSRTRRRFE